MMHPDYLVAAPRITTHNRALPRITVRPCMSDQDSKSLMQKIAAGEVEIDRLTTWLDAIHLEETALAEGDPWVINAPYSQLVIDAVRENIAERRAAVEWKFKQAAVAVWCHRIEANRRGLL